MLKTEEIEINGHNFEITQFSAREALKIKFTLSKYFGSSLTSLLNALNKDINDPQVASAIDNIFNKLDENEFLNLVLRLLKNTKRNGVAINNETFDKMFDEDLVSLYKVIYKVLEVNFSDFLQKIYTNLPEQAKNEINKNTVAN